MNNYTIGLDIGVASLGWAVVDDNYEVIESGVNIFPEADAGKNEERRGFRQARRLKRRKATRIHDFEKIWKKAGFAMATESDNDILQLRLKGLEEALSEDELYSVLKYMLKHRGISYLDDDIDENATGDYQRGIRLNQQELQDKLPCQIQAERMEQYGTFRGNNTVVINGEKVTLSNVFTTSAYKKEVSELLHRQAALNERITDEFIEAYMIIFSRKREYYEGPGNELSRTNYGRYTLNLDENGNYSNEDNIFEKLIGKCSVYPTEMRAAAASYTAQEVNALNDLNDLVVNGRKLEEEEKHRIIELYLSESVVNVEKIIKKVIGEDIESLAGYRIDKNNKAIYHTFEVYRKMKKALAEISVDISTFERDDLDEIAYIMTINTERDAMVKAFNASTVSLNDEVIDRLVTFRKSNGSLFSKWHSFSLKIMNKLIPALYEQPKNQMQLLTDMGVFKGKTEQFRGLDAIPVEMIIDEIYNPVVRRSVSITVKVINALITKYGNPKKIVIEMPREKNSDEEKKQISKMQGENEKELKDVIKLVKDDYGIEITDETFRHHKGLVLKLKLWKEQGGRCVYSGRPIRIQDLINNRNLFEVDHIIPISISYDDSRNNKVLVYATENQDKSNRTPFMYLSSVHRDWNWESYVAYVKSLGYKPTKLRNLLFSEDITKIDVLKGFITRNLVDTRYASRTILNLLQSYFAAQESDTVVSVIRGSFTHQMRVNLEIEKNRDESFNHHAVDAMLIAISQMGYDAYHRKQEQIIDFETGEILSKKEWENQDDMYRELLYQANRHKITVSIMKATEQIKYWYKVDRKCNRGLCDQTIYGTREVDGTTYTVGILNIYKKEDIVKFRKKIAGGKEKDFLMYRNDPETFKQLMQIFHEYEEEENPFLRYHEETGDFVRKYAKNHNGPKIEKMKYFIEKTGSCIDISHKYGYARGAKKVILGSLVPFRMDVYKHKETGVYYLVGIKQSDIKCEGKNFVIDEAAYKRILIMEKMINNSQSRADLESLGYEFCMSFFENDVIEYEKDGEVIRERFLSRTKPQSRNYIETKPLDAPKYEKQRQIGLSKTRVIKKVVKDILGNERVVTKEKFRRIIDSI